MEYRLINNKSGYEIEHKDFFIAYLVNYSTTK